MPAHALRRRASPAARCPHLSRRVRRPGMKRAGAPRGEAGVGNGGGDRRVLLHLGAGRLMTHSIAVLREGGWIVHAVDRDPRAPGFSVADASARIDIADFQAVAAYACAVAADVVLPLNEVGVQAAAEARRRLGGPGLTPEAALRCVDKGLMRDAWEEAGLRQPRYHVVLPTTVERAARELGYPVVLKPTRGSASRGVSVVRSDQELPAAIRSARQADAGDRLIVEEWIGGTEITVEGLVQDGKVHVLTTSDKLPQEQHRSVAKALNYPASMPDEVLSAAETVVTDAAVALGIEDGAFHCECMVSGSDVFLVEMAARPGGGDIFSRIVEASSGVCMPTALAAILAGDTVDVTPLFRRGACYRFLSPPAGVYRSVTGLDVARHLPGVLAVHFELDPGTPFTTADDDLARPGAVVTEGATREEAMANADRAVASLTFTVDPC